jgi:hypothetical protein
MENNQNPITLIKNRYEFEQQDIWASFEQQDSSATK